MHYVSMNLYFSASLKEKFSLDDLLISVNKIRKRIEFRSQNGYHDASATSLVCYMMPQDPDLSDQVVYKPVLCSINAGH